MYHPATATDCDLGSNAELTYSITTTGASFSIDSATGAISPAEALDYESGPQYYQFEVMAVDGGSSSLSGSATVIISIIDVNEPPVFRPSDYSFRMDENSATGYQVGTVYVSDDDVGDSLTLQIIGGDGTFSIDATTG